MISQRFCLGTAQFGMNYGVANRSGQPPSEKVRAIVAAAIERGVVYFDTAQAYGESEAVLGKALQDLRMTDRARLVTKLRPDFEFRGAEQLNLVVAESLDRLCCSSLWGLLLHRAELKGHAPDFFEAVAGLKKQGITRFFGVSVYTPEEALLWLDCPELDLLQIPFNALDRRWFDCGVLARIEASGVQLFVRSVYLQGLLLMQPDQLEKTGMAWAGDAVGYLSRHARAAGYERPLFTRQMVLQSCPGAVLVLGVDSHTQLEENLCGFGERSLAPSLVVDWWRNLPDFDEKILNPVLWTKK